MSDVTIIDTVETAETNLGNKIDGLSGTIEGLPQEVQEQLNAFKTTIDELKKNVEDTLADVQETVENSPAGIPAPPLASMSAQSTENGIEVTYQAALLFGRSSNNFVVEDQDNLDQIFSVTKGVMIRYSNESYPLTPKDGNLAIIDEDIFTLNADTGIKTAKQKTYEIVGLTNNETYYISAFPYNSNYAYQEAAGQNHKNRVKCQWTGTKGTLTVNVTQDYDYKPLGEYTATMTPTAGGSAVTKTQSGAATIVFSGLEAGQYTLSFSAPQYFTAPKSKNVTVVAGQSQTLDKVFVFTPPSLSECDWNLINSLSLRASEFWSVGDTKDVTVNGEALTFEIVGFNHDNLSDGSGKAGITFGMKNLMSETKQMNSTDTNNGSYVGSALNDYVSGDFYNGLPAELKNVIKSVRKITGNGGSSNSWSGTRTDNFKVWLFSEQEVYGSKSMSVGNEGSKYSIFTGYESRIKNYQMVLVLQQSGGFDLLG